MLTAFADGRFPEVRRGASRHDGRAAGAAFENPTQGRSRVDKPEDRLPQLDAGLVTRGGDEGLDSCRQRGHQERQACEVDRTDEPFLLLSDRISPHKRGLKWTVMAFVLASSKRCPCKAVTSV